MEINKRIVIISIKVRGKEKLGSGYDWTRSCTWVGLIGNLEGHLMIATYKPRNKKYSRNNS